MNFVRIHPNFGIVVRKRALSEKAVALDEILKVFQGEPLDQDEELLSFGPHFGSEAASGIARTLELLGLTYVDDFFIFAADAPDWCQFGVARG